MSARTYELSVFFDWNFDDTFTDESDYVVSVNIDRSISGIGKPVTSGGGSVDRAQIELNNSSSRFSSRLSAGSLYSDIGNGGFYLVPVYITLSINNDTPFRIFTGVCSVPSENGLSPNRARTITVIALSNDELLRNSRTSLPIDQCYAWLNSYPNESQAIAYLLSLLGTSGSIESGYSTVLPLLNDDSILETIWKLAKVGSGYFFTAVDGTFTYYNMAHFVTVGNDGYITRSNSGLITQYYDDINLSKKVTVKGTSLSKTSQSTIYTHNSVITIPKNSDKTVTFALNSNAYNIGGFSWSRVITLGGTDVSSDLSYTYTNYIDKCELVFTNANTSNTMVIEGFYIIGSEVNTEDFEVTKESVNTFWGDRSTELETRLTDRYIVNYSSADAIAAMIRDRQETPIAIYVVNDYVYNSQLELLDKLTLQDTTLVDGDVPIIVTKINYRISGDSGVRMSIEGVDMTTMYPYALSTGVDAYFIIGTDEIGSSATGRARLFY